MAPGGRIDRLSILDLERLSFTPEMARRPPARGIDAITTLRHFVILTYALPAERLRPLIHPRFELEEIDVEGRPSALLSVVPFEDQDFRAAVFPSPRWRFGQTNYRVYVVDRESGRRAVWFLGTCLGSWTVTLPRYLWRLPWHHGRFRFDCEEDAEGVYRRYEMETRGRWAPARLSLVEAPETELALPGFPDRETGLVVLTHPLEGYYRRRDGRLGSYSVWHAPLEPRPARLLEARFDLLERLGLLSPAEQQRPHSVLIQAWTEFLIQLPPRAVEDKVRSAVASR